MKFATGFRLQTEPPTSAALSKPTTPRWSPALLAHKPASFFTEGSEEFYEVCRLAKAEQFYVLSIANKRGRWIFHVSYESENR